MVPAWEHPLSGFRGLRSLEAQSASGPPLLACMHMHTALAHACQLDQHGCKGLDSVGAASHGFHSLTEGSCAIACSVHSSLSCTCAHAVLRTLHFTCWGITVASKLVGSS